jgi:hypothetical protein
MFVLAIFLNVVRNEEKITTRQKILYFFTLYNAINYKLSNSAKNGNLVAQSH